MTTPTQNQNKAPQDKQAQPGKQDDMHNTGAQANTGQTAGKDADQDVQDRKDAPKADQNN